MTCNDINLVPKMGQVIKVQRPVSSTPINGMYHRTVCDIRGRIYNCFAGGIIVQSQKVQTLIMGQGERIQTLIMGQGECIQTLDCGSR
jgi:hypothetical protein